MAALVELPEAVASIAVDPIDSEVAAGGVHGTVHVCPLDTGGSGAPPAATIFHSSKARGAISHTTYLAPPGGGRAVLVTAAEDGACLRLRAWAVDRAALQAEHQVHLWPLVRAIELRDDLRRCMVCSAVLQPVLAWVTGSCAAATPCGAVSAARVCDARAGAG